MVTPPNDCSLNRTMTSSHWTDLSDPKYKEGTRYYSLDQAINDEDTDTAAVPVVPVAERKRAMDTPEPLLQRKTTKLTETCKTPTVHTTPIRPPDSIDADDAEYTPETPEWESHQGAWGYLQSLRTTYKSAYLKRVSCDANSRTGYLLGRRADCDIRFNQAEISKSHCLIYMENGNDGRRKGVCIYLEDQSSNGTFVNGVMVGRGNRVMLKSGDRIQLYRRELLPDDDPRQLFYRLILPPRFEAGTFHEDYKMGSYLGHGNFAQVYKATHKSDPSKVVAVKIIGKSKFERKPNLLPSIIQEIGILMSLEAHPCVIKIEKVFNEPKYIYLVLEYVKNGELFDHVKERRNLTELETRFVFWQLFAGIQFLHGRGIVHRDLKPENILLARKDQLHVKISDFGLAKMQQGEEPLESQCGTPNYVAPEILDPAGTRAYGKECDLWSLGVMLYICLSGTPPFHDEYGPPSMKYQIRQGIYSFPSPYWDGISEQAKDLVTQLMTVDVKQRATIEEAMSHPWMKMDYERIQAMAKSLDPKLMSQLEELGHIDEGLLPTQPV